MNIPIIYLWKGMMSWWCNMDDKYNNAQTQNSNNDMIWTRIFQHFTKWFKTVSS